MKTKTTIKILTAALVIWLSAVKTNAQIVYTDIDLDTTIYEPNVQYIDSLTYYSIDLNFDSINDFVFVARHYKNQNQEGTELSYNVFFNSCVNCKVTGGCTEFGVRNDIYFNDTIYQNLIWDVKMNILFDVFGLGAMYCELPIGDIYIGMKFIKNTNTYFGWVRCSATDTSITIKDYAYNSTPDEYILVGQTVTGNDTLTLKNNINIYESSNTLNIDFSNALLAQGTIKLYNTFGVLLKTVTVNGLNNSLSLTGITQGIYIIRVETPNAILNKQIYLQGN